MNIQKSISILLVSLTAVALAADGKTYGESLTLTEITKISQILDDPEAYVGRRVLIEGPIVDVCPHRGCWINVASDRPYEQITVKVDDGVIVFPLSAKGHRATVEGVVEKLHFTKEEMLARKKHQAEQRGEPFDSTTVEVEAQTIYRIRGIGAVIEE
jgi:hypothetical protein